MDLATEFESGHVPALSEWFISMYVRFLWTGQRIETFYTLLVKDVLSSGDVDVVDTKDNRQGPIL